MSDETFIEMNPIIKDANLEKERLEPNMSKSCRKRRTGINKIFSVVQNKRHGKD